MTSHSPSGFAARLSLFGAIAALMVGFGAVPAVAATADATPDSGLSATEATAVEVTGSGYAASTQYRAGLCSAETY
jgi:hypothetical protein